MEAEDLVADGVQEMGLAEADSAVEEEGVVAVRGPLGDGAGGGVGELVGGAADEVGESVAGVELRRLALFQRLEDPLVGGHEDQAVGFLHPDLQGLEPGVELLGIEPLAQFPLELGPERLHGGEHQAFSNK
jgi:hypothetical protein